MAAVLCAPAALRAAEPLRIGVAGVSHGHIHEVISKAHRGDFTVVGVWEANDSLRAATHLHDKVDGALFYADLDRMLDQTQPEAIVAFGPVYDHLQVVEACAPRGIHVMVEKPLAVSVEHAHRIADLARRYGIIVMTNYETTWYATNDEAFRLVRTGVIGEITRMNIFDGHQGPVEIGCGPEFLAWLTDPKLNGGGAVMDFGCYGANLATKMFLGEKPLKASGVLKQQKPHIYPKVDDDATIVLEYPTATVEIMASWNWPMNRKDMHIYGSRGYIYQDSATDMRLYTGGRETHLAPQRLPAPYDDSFRYLAALVRGEITMAPYDLSALENNVTVVEILEAAKHNAAGTPRYIPPNRPGRNRNLYPPPYATGAGRNRSPGLNYEEPAAG